MTRICLMTSVLCMSLVITENASADVICDRLAAAVEGSIKELSYYEYDGIFDNSAVRQTNRQLGKSVEMAVIQANLTLMQGYKCALPKLLITLNAYSMNAFECHSAGLRIGKSPDVSKGIPECDRSEWSRSYFGKKNVVTDGK